MTPENKLFCSTPGSTQEQQRLATLSELGLLETESIPVFEEATQTAAHFLNAPICVLGLVDYDRQWFKAAIGLSRIGLMNDLASSRQLPRQEAFCASVVDRRQVLIINDAVAHPAFANSLLTQRYGIRAYLGVPLFAANGCCLGTLAIMDLAPREFTVRDAELLELTARWCMSEFERNRLLKIAAQGARFASASSDQQPHAIEPPIHSVKVNLMTQMTQELRTPLTSILGMASVLNRQIYGSLTNKQKEYIDIVHSSGQYLLLLVNEILELGELDDRSQNLNLSPVDIEMLCQQALATLEQVARQREQKIHLTIEPGSRIWSLDKHKVRQLLYHLVFGVIQLSSADSVIRVHISRKRCLLNLNVWTSHPWLGDGLPQAALPDALSAQLLKEASVGETAVAYSGLAMGKAQSETTETSKREEAQLDRQSLGLMLSRRLAELHGGSLMLQGSMEAGYRYEVSLPQLNRAGGGKASES